VKGIMSIGKSFLAVSMLVKKELVHSLAETPLNKVNNC